MLCVTRSSCGSINGVLWRGGRLPFPCLSESGMHSMPYDFLNRLWLTGVVFDVAEIQRA